METSFTGNQEAVTLFLLKNSCTSHIEKRFHVLHLQSNPTRVRNDKKRTYVCTTLDCHAKFVVTPYSSTCSNTLNPDPKPIFSVEVIRQHDYNVNTIVRCVEPAFQKVSKSNF